MIRFLEGSLQKEAAFDFRVLFQESCGLAASVQLPDASRFVRDCLYLQEHRGEHSAGIVSLERGQFFMHRRLGKVREQFAQIDVSTQLPGHIAIGHNRYATQGAPHSTANIQPLLFHYTRFGSFAIAHNGTLVNTEPIRKQLMQSGVSFQSTMDSEVFGHLIARSPADTLEEAVIEATRLIPAAYSLLILSADRLIALRDPYGIRPLSFARVGGGYLICSENCALDPFAAYEYSEDIAPGEMIVFSFDPPSFRRIQYAPPREHVCIFEGIYFSSPRSRIRGYWHEDFRVALGHEIASENPSLAGDCVIPVLDSGKHAALGLSEALKIPYREYLWRPHHPSQGRLRSFTCATAHERVHTARQKFHLRRDTVADQRVIVVDDSIVRATTIRIINQRLREAGVREIINCIAAPPIADVCPFGMDFQEPSQLIASRLSIEEIQKEIGADRLLYLNLAGLERVIARTYRCGTCSGCFRGRYPAFERE